MTVETMLRLLCAYSAVAVATCVAQAQGPDDIEFHLRLSGKDTAQYRVDEPIPFEIALATSAQEKYWASWTALTPGLGTIQIRLEPRANAVDLLRLQTGFAVSILGSEGFLSDKPLIESGDLTEWYRFDKPGHFRFSISVDWVARGKERVPLTSNEVEFDVVAMDAAAANDELAAVLQQIDGSKDADKQTALRRLDLMQSSAATDEKIRRFLASSDNDAWQYSGMLTRTADPDAVIAALREALTNPASSPPQSTINLLAALMVRRQFGDPKPWPQDPEGQNAAKADTKARMTLQKKLESDYGEILLSTVRQRSGAERMNALFAAWETLEFAANEKQPIAEVQQLRQELLMAAGELTVARQAQFLATEWDRMPHSDLLPIVMRLADRPGVQDSLREQAFRYWCGDWPADCSKAIIAAGLRDDPGVSEQIVLLMPEAEHPELDDRLRAKLVTRHSAWAALILRAASKNLAIPVTDYLVAEVGTQYRNCGQDGYLLGYLLRVDSKQGVSALAHLLQVRGSNGCARLLLQALSNAENVDAAIPVVTAALKSSDLETAGSVALFLGQRATDAARPALLERLQSLRTEWRENMARAGSGDLFKPPLIMGDSVWSAAQFEQELVSAIAHAKHWTLTDGERSSLASGCLTDQCRGMAEGKSWMNF